MIAWCLQCVSNPFRIDFCQAFGEAEFESVRFVVQSLLSQATPSSSDCSEVPSDPGIKQELQQRFYRWLKRCVEQRWYASTTLTEHVQSVYLHIGRFAVTLEEFMTQQSGALRCLFRVILDSAPTSHAHAQWLQAQDAVSVMEQLWGLLQRCLLTPNQTDGGDEHSLELIFRTCTLPHHPNPPPK